MLITLAEYKALTGTTSISDDALITQLITAVQSSIETYCDRSFNLTDYCDWFPYNQNILVDQYPVNNVKFLGSMQNMASFDSDDYNYEITSTGISITDDTITTTSFAFSTYATLTALKTAIEAALPAITLTIVSGYETTSYKLLKKGTGKTVYGATRVDMQTRVVDNRTIKLQSTAEFLFYSTLDITTDVEVYVVWNAGYATSDVPSDLKLITSNIIKDTINIYKTPKGGIYKSESITNYSYTLGDQAQISKLIIDNYAASLYPYRRKTI